LRLSNYCPILQILDFYGKGRMLDIQKQIDYWRNGAQEDFEFAEEILNK